MSFLNLVFYVALTLLTVLPAGALDFYVNSATGDDRRSVQSAQNSTTPFRTITHALRIAHLVSEGRPHVIHIPAGTYSPSRGETFPLVISQSRIYIATSGVITFDAQNKANFFRLTAPTSDFVIQGITFRNGLGDQGGAIYAESCSLRVVSNIFLNNRATGSGQVLYAKNGRVKFFNNLLRDNGAAGDTGAVLSLHNTFADTTQREIIRNNTFYWNLAPAIQTSGNRTDISNNIFSNPDSTESRSFVAPPAILDASATALPLIRYNMLWRTPILYISDQADSIKLAKTVRDTVTLAEAGVKVPTFMTNHPDTVAKVGSTYLFVPTVTGTKAAYIFRANSDPGRLLPTGISAIEVQEQKQIRWVPTLADTGRKDILVEIQDPVGSLQYLDYHIRVYTAETFPDTTDKGPIINVSLVPDTVAALSRINALLPTFSTASSAGNNKYLNPKFINAAISRFELDLGSPAIDAGSPVIALRDVVSRDRNDMGHFGGPGNSGTPAADTLFKELEITSLPDSIATEGQVFTYAPTLPNNPKIDIIDLIPGLTVPPSLSRAFGKPSPIRWTPTASDTGSYLIGVTVYPTTNGQGRQYFPLRIKPANEAPVVTSTPPATAAEDSAFSYAITATDPNGDAITYAVTKNPGGVSVNTSGLVTWTPIQAQVGSDTVEVSLSDTKGATTAHRFIVTVRNTNDRPVITSQPDTLAAEDAIYAYDLAATDPDPGETLTYRLTQNPSGMTMTTQGKVRWTPTQTQVRTTPYPVTVEVKDLAGATVTQSYSLRVTATNDLPVISSRPDSAATEDLLYSYTISATDEEGGALAYALGSTPAGLALSAAGVVTWTPSQADVGRHTLTLRVSDPAGGTTTQTFAIVVAAVNDAPVITAHLPRTDGGPLVVAPLIPVQFAVTASDEEGDSLAYNWQVNGLVRPGATTAALTLTPSAAKLDTVTALVWDRSDTTRFTWVIDGRSIPRLSLDTSAVAFGEVALGDTGRVVRMVRNLGSGPLLISDLQIGDLAFTAVFAAGTVAAGDSTRLELRFVPTALEARQSTIRFATTDPGQPTVQLQLAGSGVAARRPVGDFDRSGVVDFDDFFLFADHFGGQDPVYDLDRGGTVDFNDFFLFADHFGERSAPALKRVLRPGRPANRAP
ncbi:MAG: DUF1565 domain-containing protein [Candidatus Latescibacteria bacterium]|nr:DUF1565 domain-containing protein [Candidatus Latescibacterota bacterium]